MSNRAIAQLRRLLEVERKALLAGDLIAVGQMVTEKEKLADIIEATNPLELRLLSAELTRNSALLAAAKQGVEHVLATLREQREARQTLSTYDSSGQPTKISHSVGNTLRRF